MYRWFACIVLFAAVLITPIPSVGKNAVEEPVHRIHTQKKIVALTFDDGPDPVYTPLILELLHKNGIHATFFVLGSQADKYPSVIKWIRKAGHEIGNHGYEHHDLNKLTEQQVYDEIKRTEQTVWKIAGVFTQYYRPPGGVITHDVQNAVRAIGYDLIFWSVDPRDWSLKRTAKVIVNSVKQNVTPGDIILFHDGGLNQRQMLQALQQLISDLRSQGYKFVTISQLLKEAAP